MFKLCGHRCSFLRSPFSILNSAFSILSAFLILSSQFILGCASGEGIAPSGGPPDREAPVVRSNDPVDASTMFDDDRIEIEFSEGIDENGVRDEVVITPIPARSPTITVSGRTLRIDFQDDLVPDRTYAVTVGGGLKDYSGNRLGTPVTLRFSTGATIDSGRIGGVISGREGSDGNTFIFAWRMDDLGENPDLAATPPDFIAPVSDNGRFSLEGLPAGTYRIAGVDDTRRDREIDPGEDAVGIPSGTATIGAGESFDGEIAIRLPPAPPDELPVSLFTATGETRTRTLLRFSEPVDTSGLRAGTFTLTQGGRTITPQVVWRSAQAPANLLLHHETLDTEEQVTVEVRDLTDTAGNRVVDSTRVRRFSPVERVDTVGPILSFGNPFVRGISGGDTIRLVADEGVRLVAPDGGLVATDTAGTVVHRYRLQPVSPVEIRAIPVDTVLPRIEVVRLRIDAAAFADLLGNRGSGTVDTTTTVRPTPQLGTLTGRVVDSLHPGTPHVIVLTSEFGTVYRVELPGTGPWSIENIPSESYSLEAFRDDDRDGILDYGTLSPWTPGERVITWPGGIRVRPRWTTTDVNLQF